jgi:DNA-binding HxlR family transcriptional regulator
VATGGQQARARSPLAEALTAVGDRWTLLVVEALLGGSLRFNELGEQIDGIAPNILSNRLRRLEQDGLVLAQPYSRRPPRYVYELTSAGRELAGALRLLADWGARHSDAEPVVHGACGSTLEARWYCPTCDRTVEEPDEEGVHYA